MERHEKGTVYIGERDKRLSIQLDRAAVFAFKC